MPTNEELEALWEGIEMLRGIAQSRNTTLDMCMRGAIWRLTLGGMHHVEDEDLRNAVLGARIRWKKFDERQPTLNLKIAGCVFEPIGSDKYVCRDWALTIARSNRRGRNATWTARRGVAYIYSQKKAAGIMMPRQFRSMQEAAEAAIDTWVAKAP